MTYIITATLAILFIKILTKLFNRVSRKLCKETASSNLPQFEKDRQLRIMHSTIHITETVLFCLSKIPSPLLYRHLNQKG